MHSLGSAVLDVGYPGGRAILRRAPSSLVTEVVLSLDLPEPCGSIRPAFAPVAPGARGAPVQRLPSTGC